MIGVRAEMRAGSPVETMTIAAATTGTNASHHHGRDDEVVAVAAAEPVDADVERDAERNRNERREDGDDGVGADEARRDLVRGEPDGAENAEVTDPFAHGEQGDGEERGDDDADQDGVEGVDEGRKLGRHVAGLVRIAGGERRLYAQGEHDRAGRGRDHGDEQHRPAAPGEQVLEPEHHRKRGVGAVGEAGEA